VACLKILPSAKNSERSHSKSKTTVATLPVSAADLLEIYTFDGFDRLFQTVSEGFYFVRRTAISAELITTQCFKVLTARRRIFIVFYCCNWCHVGVNDNAT